MNSDRNIAKIAGILFLTGMVSGLFSIAPAIDAPEFLTKAAQNANQVIISAISQFIMAIAYLGIAISMFPLLKKQDETLALGFLSFRVAAVVLIMIGTMFLLLLLSLSQKFTTAFPRDVSYFQTLGDLLRSARDLVNHVLMILTVSIGGLMFYSLLYKTRLIPQWISVSGVFGTMLTILASFLVMFQAIDIITPIYMVLNIPTALTEIALAIWLIAKGFNQVVIKSINTRLIV
jgi:hypothetical protein